MMDTGSGGSGQHQRAEYRTSDKLVLWDIKKISGGQELSLMVKLVADSPSAVTAATRRELGPVSITFDVPMYSCSNVQIKALRAMDREAPPLRWIRTITQSDSYVARIS
jgi:AP-4 complex subunit mu-1